MTKQTSCLQQLVYYHYLQYLGHQKLSKQHIKQINIMHVTLCFKFVFVLFSCDLSLSHGFPGQVCNLIVSIPDICHPLYLN